MKKGERKQFCVRGHDVFSVCRDSDGMCNACRKLADLTYYKNNKLKIKLRHRIYYRENRIRLNKHQIEYRANNPDKFYKYDRQIETRFSHSKAYAKKHHHIWKLTLEEYKKLLNNPCYYCGVSLVLKTGVGLDRIDNNKSIGYVLDNVLPCCGVCNRIRSDIFSVEEMKLIGKVLKNIRKSHDR